MKIDLVTSRYGRIVHALLSGSAARLLSACLTLISLPLAVRYLGAERYGVWATVATTAVWLNLLDFGIANTLTNHISRAFALDDAPGAARAFTNALLLTSGAALFVGLIFALAIPAINWSRLFNVSASVRAAEIRNTVAAAAFLTLLGLPCSLGSKILAGYQELHRNNYVLCAGALAGVAGLCLGIAVHASMATLFVMSAGCNTLASLANLLMVTTWRKPWLRPRPAYIDCTCIVELMSSGSSFLLIQMAAVVVFSSDNLIVSHYLGAAQVTPYSVTWRLVGLAAVLQSLLFPALWPAYAEAYAKGDSGWIRRTFTMTLRGTLGLNFACVLLLMGFGRPLIRVWAGAAAVPSLSLLLAMGIWALINGLMSVESCLLAALNQVRGQALLSVMAAGVNIGLSLLLVRRIGALGVVSGTILSYLLVLVVPQTLIVRRIFRRELAGGKGTLFALRSSRKQSRAATRS